MQANEMSSPSKLSIVECGHCGAAYWWAIDRSVVFVAGPCCFGHPVLSIERFPTEYTARQNYPAFIKARERAIEERLKA